MIAPTLLTERLILTGGNLARFDDQAALFADPRTTAFMQSGPQARDEAWRRFCQASGMWALLGYGYWTVLERGSGAVVGTAGFGRFERGIAELADAPEAGWAFGPDHWGRGYATETMTAALAWADERLNAREIRCFIAADNLASIRVAEKCGFEQFAERVAERGRDLFFRRRTP